MLLPIQIIMYKNQISRVFRNFSSLRTTLTEEDKASCSRAFQKPKNAEEERKLIENATPNSTIPLGKQKSSTRALHIHNWQVLSAMLGHYYI